MRFHKIARDLFSGLIAGGMLLSGIASAQSPEDTPTTNPFAAGVGPHTLEKKLIEYGWDVPTPAFLAKHLPEMNRRPFDGVVFKLNAGERTIRLDDGRVVPDNMGGSRVFSTDRFPEEDFAEEYEILRGLEWGSFTDNFIMLFSASDLDWFSDEDWDAITNNTRLVARAARIAGCKGLVLDQEPYGTNPWVYLKAEREKLHPFDVYEAKARERGAQFMRAIQAEFPEPYLLTLFQMTFLKGALRPMPPQDRAAWLGGNDYALLPAFLEGMLEAANPGTIISDGNEVAYYYTNKEIYLEDYHMVRNLGRYVIDPALWPKYQHHMRADSSLYIDQYLALREHHTPAIDLNAEERLAWLEHNTYWALQTADRYVWCYNEKVNWWDTGAIAPDAPELNKMSWPGGGVPAGVEETIRSARARYNVADPPPFNPRAAIDAARARLEAAEQ